jgi:hypothetical protein
MNTMLGEKTGYDEWAYLKPAQNYSKYLLDLDISSIINDQSNISHPQLAKFLYAGGILIFGDILGFDYVLSARLIAIIIACIISILLFKEYGLISSIFWIFSSWSLTFTCQIYLDPALTLFCLLTIIFYLRFEKSLELERGQHVLSIIKKKYFWLTLLFASASIASKYTGIIVFALILMRFIYVFLVWNEVDNLYEKVKKVILLLAIWSTTFFGYFLLFNPRTLKISHFVTSFFSHFGYASDTYALKKAYHPPLGQLTYFIDPSFWGISQKTFPFIDGFLLLFAILGIILFFTLNHRFTKRLNQFLTGKKEKYNLMFYFFILYVFFLVLWPTKWPQYLLPLLIPIVVFSDLFFRLIYFEFFIPLLEKWKKVHNNGYK